MSKRWTCIEPGNYDITAQVGGAEILDEIISHHELTYIGEEKDSIYLNTYEYEAEPDFEIYFKERRAFEEKMEHYFNTKGYNFYLYF
ncbi:hypothetical protein [Paenibacillus herberti]|uniref:Uncharacterized protein n=1 Tax=Paenibacillus herberti TaxID=1619309 RepID=A0A229NY70_9BACL|nr:hypothetical protein [Paenibacillus herberti]OXM14966.1 hypothetical protein CGZ75_19140 [Paenibacillus herberti]